MDNSAGPGDCYVRAGGHQFHLRLWGAEDMPTVLVIHGAFSHAHEWDHVASAMSDRFRLVVPDLRGHGESGWANDYSWQRFPEDITALASTLGLRRFSLLGHSLGGWIAYLIAATRPEVVDRLALVEAAPPDPWPDDGGQAAPPDPVVRKYSSLSEAADEYQRSFPRADADLIRHSVLHGLKEQEIGMWVGREDPRLQAATWQSRLRPGADTEWQALAVVGCPTLVVRGEHGVSAERAQKVLSVLRAGRLVTIPDAGHLLPLENPTALVRTLYDFFMMSGGAEP